MDISKYKVDGDQQVKLQEFATSEDHGIDEKELREKQIPDRVKKLKELHLRLHAEEKKGIVVVLQAMDAAGKDEAISYIFSNLNAQGLKTTSFQKPSDTEKSHDYLWRIREGLPARGQVGILNRSHYEEVIAPRIHDLLGDEVIPDNTEKEKVWSLRFRQINDFEQYMVENGFEVVKFFFNMSKEEQKKRLLERMKDPEKNWEFSFRDVEERQHWDSYQEIFEDMLNHTSTEAAPWYILPADDEWYSRSIITEAMIQCLEKIDPQFPEISQENQDKLDQYIKQLENE
ncbi:PPK2 family polyphosphate kinase [Jeotgalibacillus campisalis]|uniref:Polyphosphate:nucleotide phosphotransferase n=1 Tax=Jeotgalibacillus campisalis TaxID=220754 RepID=A0A0C2W4R5_9BACL|nr:phosphate--nucleotide phosphotransferase [Jeotgalibacillus campisalis]KIL51003.1 polyphosphate:nucleotide phosphotransferase [Jeotgalibacillus campisalis]